MQNPVPEALQSVATLVDDIVQVSNEPTSETMRLVYKLVGILVEPAGAVGVAAAMAYQGKAAGQLLATPFYSSNMTEAQIAQWF